MALAALAAGAEDVDLLVVRERFEETLDALFDGGLSREERELRIALGVRL